MSKQTSLTMNSDEQKEDDFCQSSDFQGKDVIIHVFLSTLENALQTLCPLTLNSRSLHPLVITVASLIENEMLQQA